LRVGINNLTNLELEVSIMLGSHKRLYGVAVVVGVIVGWKLIEGSNVVPLAPSVDGEELVDGAELVDGT
jgi:hypothetical protein